MYPKKLPIHHTPLYTNDTCFFSPLNLTRGFIEKNYVINMHKQEFYEINIIIKGSGMHYIKNKSVLAKVGDVFIIPPHVAHGYYSDKDFDVYHILLSNEFIIKHIKELEQFPNFHILFTAEPLMRSATKKTLHLSLNKTQMEKIQSLLIPLSNSQDYHDTYQCLHSTYLTIHFILSLCEIYNFNISQNKILSEDEYFMKSISYIHEHYNEKITLDFLVALSQMSRSSYINKFKQICKMPPLTYLNKVRIKIAKDLISNTDLPITEVAYNTGFYDCSHFTKIFTKECDISPYAIKKQKTC